jgi:hypothetical protein
LTAAGCVVEVTVSVVEAGVTGLVESVKFSTSFFTILPFSPEPFT